MSITVPVAHLYGEVVARTRARAQNVYFNARVIYYGFTCLSEFSKLFCRRSRAQT